MIEEEYEKVKIEERKWMETGRREGRDKVVESRKRWKKVVEQVKREHWLKYVEGLEERDGYKWVKTDRDFLVDIPGIRNKEGKMVEEDEEKARALVRGLGKREEEEQELEGFYEKVEVEEEELGEMIKKQGDGKAAGENGLGGKVLKMMWRVDWCRREIKEVVEGSLSLGYVCERWRRSVGIVMRKPNKLDYGSPNSYRIINLLDVLGKVVERILARRLERWGQEGMGDEQFGGRVGRSCMDGVGKLYADWEKGGRKGLLLCMDVKGGYENVGVNKGIERLESLGVDEYMVRWVSSFLRERKVRVKIGGRMSEWVEMKGGTIQGSPLSPILFMFILGGVLEEVRKEEVEGVSVIGCVDDVDFMVVGEDEEMVVERVKRMEKGLERGLRKWEVDVQELKLEGLWMRRDSEEWGREVKWLGEEIKLKESMRVLGVWWQKNGGYEEHLKQRLMLGDKRWELMMKLLGRGGRGMRVKDLKRIWKMVVGQSVMYGMELYWDGQENLRRRLQVWLNKGMRRILGCVRTTRVDAMLGELGEKRVEYELDRKVQKWGWRLLRKGKGKVFGEEWRERERNGGCYESWWVGRMMRGVKKHKLGGERWEIEEEREGKGRWKVVIGEGKEKAKEKWLEGKGERDKEWVVAVSDAGGEGNGMGIGGGWWEGGEKRGSGSLNGGWGLTVMMGEMCGVKVAMERVEAEYRGEKRKLMVGVDNVGVLKCLRKGRGMCSEGEKGVRRVCLRMERKGWEVVLVWVPGHVEIEENEEADELASEGSWDDEEMEEWKEVLGWGKWEERRKKEESRRWKEFWIRKRKGEEYFGVGGRGELGHEGERWKSRFLVWMRTNHGRMGGMRYRKDGERCECGGRDDRDHLLLYCKKWEKERKEVWKGCGMDGWVMRDGWKWIGCCLERKG